jgi:hypothetical protein
LKLLTQALGDAADAGSKQGITTNKSAVVSKVTGDTTHLAQETQFQAKPHLANVYNATTGGFTPELVTGNGGTDLDDFIQNNQGTINSALSKALPTATAAGKLDAKSSKQIAATITNKLVPKYTAIYNSLDPDQQAEYLSPAAFAKNLQRGLAGSIGGTNLASGAASRLKLDDTEVNSLISGDKGVQSTYQNQVADLQPGDLDGQVAAAAQQVKGIKAAIALAADKKNLGDAYTKLDQAEAAYASVRIQQAEELRTSAQSKATSVSQIAAIGQAAFKQEAIIALQNKDYEDLKSILNEASDHDVAIVKNALDKQKALDAAAVAADKKADAAAGYVSATSAAATYGTSGGHYSGSTFIPDTPAKVGSSKQTKKDAAALAADNKNLATFNKYTNETAQATKDSSTFDSGGLSSSDQIQNKIDQRNQFADSQFTQDADDRAIKDAKDQLSILKPADAGYWAAVKAYNDAKRAYADEVAINSKNVEEQLSTDLTDPVAQAKVALDKAKDTQAQLNKNIANGKTTFASKADEVAAKRQDQLDTTQAGLSLQNTSESQFLSDLQTAQDLGKISSGQYINLLQNRRAQLVTQLAEAKKTGQGVRQYQDEINAIDEATKSAADTLNGQFNLGDIKVPTVYEVRKAIAAKTGGGDILQNNGSFSAAGNVTNDTSTKTVILNGVPIQEVLKTVKDLLGKKARANTNRKVNARA